MRQDILARLQSDLDATGLAGRFEARRELPDIDEVGLLDEEGDLDPSHRGEIGLAHRLPGQPAPTAVRALRAAAEFLQSYLVETSQLQWPACVTHSNTVLTPAIDREQRAVWMCASARAGTPHLVGEIGFLSAAASDIGVRGRLPRRRKST